MAFLISIVFFHRPSVFLVVPPGDLPHAVFAPIPQSIFVFGLFAKFTLVLPLFAFGTLLHFCISLSLAMLWYEPPIRSVSAFSIPRSLAVFGLNGNILPRFSLLRLAALMLRKES